MKAFAVIGYHHTGKTTVVTRLIHALTARGFSVATIKDIHNEAYRADIEGKNSWKHIQAGAVSTFARGLQDSALIIPKPLSLAEMAAFLKADYLIIEGMKSAPVPKILCAAQASELKELYDDTVIAVSGLISTANNDGQEGPILDAEKDIEQLTQLVIDRVFDLLPDSDPACCSACGLTCYEMAAAILKGEKQRSDCISDHQEAVTVRIDGQSLAMVPFVQRLLRDLILGFVGNLKGADPNGNITIEVKRHA